MIIGAEFTLAGLGALFLGVGSFLSGMAAVMLARKKGKEEAKNDLGGGGE